MKHYIPITTTEALLINKALRNDMMNIIDNAMADILIDKINKEVSNGLNKDKKMINNPYIEGAEADAFDFGYQRGCEDSIDEFVNHLSDIFEYRHDMNEIKSIAGRIKGDLI